MLTNSSIFDKLSEHVSGFDGADTATKDDTTRNTKVSKGPVLWLLRGICATQTEFSRIRSSYGSVG